MNQDMPDENLSNEMHEQLSSSYRSTQLPPQLENAIVEELKKRRLIVNKSFLLKPLFRVAAVIILIACTFYFGLLFGKQIQNRMSAGLHVNDLADTYLILLYNPADFNTQREHVREYTEWATELRSKGFLVAGSALNHTGWELKKEGITNLNGVIVSGVNKMISGFFLIRADSEKQAMDIASECPHLKYKGVIEFRPLLGKISLSKS